MKIKYPAVGIASLLLLASAYFLFSENPHANREQAAANPNGIQSPSHLTDSSPAAIAASAPKEQPAPQPVALADNRPVSQIGTEKAAYPGVFSEAAVTVRGKSYHLTPNQLGHFERINIQPLDKVAVQLSYPQGQAGDPVQVEAEDGGTLDHSAMATVAKLDQQKNIQFTFKATEQPGIYRLLVRNGSDVKTLNFWAGQEPALRGE